LTYEADTLNQYSTVTPDGAPEVIRKHDVDGNLEEDVNYSYTWNGENRLVTVTPLNPQNGDTRLTFTYDYQGRRVSKSVETHTSGLWSQLSSLSHLYDGWNLISEISNPGSQIETTKSFLWGLDLSGSLQGAVKKRGVKRRI
jgi:hypothetical protein